MEGLAEVSGLRFKDVSSTNGKFFKLQCEVTSPTEVSHLVRKALSQKIEIKTCRCRSKTFANLQPHDPIEKMPGIGKQYAKRFEDNGFSRIAQLAEIPVDVAGASARQCLLDSIRKDKGTLTENKLLEYVNTAKLIVANSEVTIVRSAATSVTSDNFSSRQSSPLSALDSGVAPCDDQQETEGSEWLEKLPLPAKRPKTNNFQLGNTLVSANNDENNDENNNNNNDDDNDIQIPMLFPVECVGFQSSSLPLVNETCSQECNFAIEDNDLTNSTNMFADAMEAAMEHHPSQQLLVNIEPYRSAQAGKTTKAQVLPIFPLHTAVGTGNLSFCQRFVSDMRKRQRVVDQFNQQQLTPLMLAASLGKADIVTMLCQQREVLPGRTRSDGWSALHFAAFNKRQECVAALLKEESIDTTSKTSSGWTALMMAVMQGDVATASLLLEAEKLTSFDVEKHKAHDWSLLHLAALSGSTAMLDVVLHALGPTYLTTETNTNKKESNGLSLVHCAALSGSVDAILWLTNKGCHYTTKYKGLWFPLHMTTALGHVECVQLLCDLDGVNVNSCVGEGLSPLGLCRRRRPNRWRACEKALLSAGAVDS